MSMADPNGAEFPSNCRLLTATSSCNSDLLASRCVKSCSSNTVEPIIRILFFFFFFRSSSCRVVIPFPCKCAPFLSYVIAFVSGRSFGRLGGGNFFGRGSRRIRRPLPGSCHRDDNTEATRSVCFRCDFPRASGSPSASQTASSVSRLFTERKLASLQREERELSRAS